MLGTILIHSGNKTNRDKKIKEILLKISKSFENFSHPDLLIIKKESSKNSIGINSARKVINFLVTKPYSAAQKVVVVDSAHFLTLQAQNALLKTLEEPPSYALIILEAKTEDSLLETVVSRCRKIKTKSDLIEFKDEIISISEIKNSDIGEKLNIAFEISKKESDEIISIIESWIMQEREQMLKNPVIDLAKNIEHMESIKNDIENTNVNKRLALEVLVLNISGLTATRG